MKTIIDQGKQGAEYLSDIHIPVAEPISPQLEKIVENIKKLPSQSIELETIDGIRKMVSVRSLALINERAFRAAHILAAHELAVYAQKVTPEGTRTVMGMLSPNYSAHGEYRQPAIKVIPLQNPQPLTTKSQPNAETMTMLTGAVSAERKGVGADGADLSSDFEHRATFLGAISLNNPTIAISHKNHEVRKQSAVASGLSDGKLGDLYVPTPSFSGFAEPMVFDPGQTAADDILFIPDSFLEGTDAFGMGYVEAPEVMLGAGLVTLQERHGRDGASIVEEKIRELVEVVPHHA